jgi:ABC-type transport system involved in multi-copper enzyme maturation permease subunit
MLGYTFGVLLLLYCASCRLPPCYDEKAKWDKYAAAMPYSRKDVVLSKYLLGLGCMVVSLIVVFIGSLVYGMFTDVVFTGDSLAELVIMLISLFCVTLIFMAVNMPIIFKWGHEKGRMIFIAGIAAFAAIIGASSVIENTSIAIEGFFNNYFYIIVVAAIVLTAASIPLSIKFYERREL